MTIPRNRRARQKGSALLLFILALGIFLFGALGLALDGAQIFTHRQLAQAAADAAAQAGMMSIFNGTNTKTGIAFGTGSPPASFTCTATDVRTPCVYARNNGFGSTSTDTVTVSFPSAVSGVRLASDPVSIIQVNVQRTVTAGMSRFLGFRTITVGAQSKAAILDINSWSPIVVTHPTMSAALTTNGGPSITICGGPNKSIQVNSSSATAVTLSSNTTINLSKAGPKDPGDCSTGTGSDFGVYGGPTTPGFNLLLGTAGRYLQPASPVRDPYGDIPAPTLPADAPAKVALGNGVNGCPVAPSNPCNLYSPGYYNNGITVKNETAVFKPGIYYIGNSGFSSAANGDMMMATGFAPDPDTGQGMLVYNSGSGNFSISANGTSSLTGSLPSGKYRGILFFQNRSAAARSHTLGGGGAMTLVGTVYLTNPYATMISNPSQYQSLTLSGGSGSSTVLQGDIVTGALSLGGNSGITMRLSAAATKHLRQVALIE